MKFFKMICYLINRKSNGDCSARGGLASGQHIPAKCEKCPYFTKDESISW